MGIGMTFLTVPRKRDFVLDVALLQIINVGIFNIQLVNNRLA